MVIEQAETLAAFYFVSVAALVLLITGGSEQVEQ